MNARYRDKCLSVKERQAAAYAAKRVIEKQLDDVARRAQYLWMCAALNAGFTAEDIERIQSEMPQVCEKYGELRADNCADFAMLRDFVPFPVSWTVKMKKKQKETQDILSYHTQAAGCSDKARAKASGGRQPIEECGRTGL